MGNIFTRSPREQFILTVGGPNLDEQFSIPWEAFSVVVSNHSTQTVKLPDVNIYIPPGIVGRTIPLPGVTRAEALFQAPPATTDPAAVAGQIAILDFFAEDLPPHPGVPTDLSDRSARQVGQVSVSSGSLALTGTSYDAPTQSGFTPPANAVQVGGLDLLLNKFQRVNANQRKWTLDVGGLPISETLEALAIFGEVFAAKPAELLTAKLNATLAPSTNTNIVAGSGVKVITVYKIVGSFETTAAGVQALDIVDSHATSVGSFRLNTQTPLDILIDIPFGLPLTAGDPLVAAIGGGAPNADVGLTAYYTQF